MLPLNRKFYSRLLRCAFWRIFCYSFKLVSHANPAADLAAIPRVNPSLCARALCLVRKRFLNHATGPQQYLRPFTYRRVVDVRLKFILSVTCSSVAFVWRIKSWRVVAVSGEAHVELEWRSGVCSAVARKRSNLLGSCLTFLSAMRWVARLNQTLVSNTSSTSLADCDIAISIISGAK